MYFPATDTPDPADYQAQDVQVVTVQTSDGLNVSGWYWSSREGLPTIIYFHGNARDHAGRRYWVDRYLEAGYGVLLAGYRGYGGNPGSPSEQGFYMDARAYIEWFQAQSKDPFIIFGESIGSGVATQMATEYQERALILQAPFKSALAVAESKYFFLPVSFLMKDQFHNNDKIADIGSDLLIIHGDRDMVIPYEHGQALYQKAKEPKQLIKIKDAGHNNLHNFSLQQRVLHFLSTLQ